MSTSTMYKLEGTGLLKRRVPVAVDTAKIQADFIANITAEGQKIVNKLLDDQAKAKGYDGIVSACSYASANNTFQKESQQFVAWRGAVWEYLYNYVNGVKAGTQTFTTIDAVIAGLPQFDAYVVA